MGQQRFSDMALSQKSKVIRQEQFLKKMDQIIPWKILMKPIRKHYPETGNSWQAIDLEIMLRIYFMQQWYGLSDPAMKDSLYEIEAMRQFAGIGLDDIPDKITLLNFRYLLERHSLTETLLRTVDERLFDRRK